LNILDKQRKIIKAFQQNSVTKIDQIVINEQHQKKQQIGKNISSSSSTELMSDISMSNNKFKHLNLF